MQNRYRNLTESSGRWGMLSLAISIMACYGTLGVVGLLAAIGTRLAIDTGIWTGAILSFAWAAVALIAIGARVHGSYRPASIGLLGVALLTYTLLADYRVVLEFGAFVLMGLAAGFDYRLRRRSDEGRARSAPGEADLTNRWPSV